MKEEHIKKNTKNDETQNNESHGHKDVKSNEGPDPSEDDLDDTGLLTQIPNNQGSEEPNSNQEKSKIRESNWKNKSSHTLENLTSPLDPRMQTRSKVRNQDAFSSFISIIEPKNIKKDLKDIDWVFFM